MSQAGASAGAGPVEVPGLADGARAALRVAGQPGLRGLWRRFRADLAALGLLWGLCALYLWRLFSPIASLRLHVVQGDFTNQFYPFRYFAAAEWHAGRVPLWNPYVFAGHPFLADVQTAVFYPPSLVTALVFGRDGLSMTALELEMTAHYPLAALFTYLLGRQLLGSRFGATVAAAVFTFSGFLTSYPAQQLAMLETAVWLPLIVLLLERGATRGGLRWHLAAGLAFGVAILAGHSQTALFIGYFALAYLAYRTLSLGRPWRSALLGGGLFVLAGFGLAAVQVLPTAELLGLSTRASMDYEVAGHGYERRALLGILLPGWRGEKALYVGILPLCLAALAVATRGRPARFGREAEGRGGRAPFPTLFLCVVAGLAMILSLGARGYLFRPLYLYAPGFALFRDQERIIYLFAFAVSLLAGAGASYLVDLSASQAARLRGLWLALAGGVAFALAGSALLLYLGDRAPATFDPHGSLAGCLGLFVALVAASAAVLLLRRLTSRNGLLAAAALAVIVLDLFAVNYGNNLTSVDPNPTPRYAALVGALRSAPEEYRFRGENDETFPPNYAAVWRLPTINGDTPFMLQRAADFLFADQAEWRRWQVLNVKYFLSRGSPFEGIELALESDGIRAYRMTHSLPRAWAVRAVQVAADPADALRRVLAPEYHPGDVAVLEEEPRLGPFVKGDRPDVRIVSYTSQRVAIEAQGDGNAILVLADTYYPGWRATLDGHPTPLLRANYVARAVELPPGEHRIELVFDPVSFRLGALVSGLTLLVGAAALVAPALLARRAGARPRSFLPSPDR